MSKERGDISEQERRCLEMLGSAFADERIDVRIKAVKKAMACKTVAVARVLYEQLKSDESPFVRSILVKAVIVTGKGEFVRQVAGSLRDSDDRVRANTIEALGLFRGNPGIIGHIMVHLDDPNERVREAARKVLTRVDAKLIGQTIRLMLKSPRDKFRRFALSFLKNTMMSAKKPPKLDRRASAVWDIVQTSGLKREDIHPTDTLELARPLLNDPDRVVRRQAAIMVSDMAQSGVKGAAEVLEESGVDLLSIPELKSAVDAAKRGGPGLDKALRDGLMSKEGSLRLKAIDRIVSEHKVAFIPMLRECLDREEDNQVQKQLLAAIGKLGTGDDRGLVLSSLASGTMMVKLAAIEALGELGDESSLDAVEELISDRNMRVRSLAYVILCRSGRRDADNLLEELVLAGDRESLLLALNIIRQLPDGGLFHHLIVQIHNSASDPRVISLAQDTEKALLRSNRVEVSIVCSRNRAGVSVGPSWLPRALQGLTVISLLMSVVVFFLTGPTPPNESHPFLEMEKSGRERRAFVRACIDAGRLADAGLLIDSLRSARGPVDSDLVAVLDAMFELAAGKTTQAEKIVSGPGGDKLVFNDLAGYFTRKRRLIELEKLLLEKGAVDYALPGIRDYLDILERRGEYKAALRFLDRISAKSSRLPGEIAARRCMFELLKNL